MKDHGLGVEVIINDIKANPCCTHGPTILFERFNSNGSSSRYYACSACRDRRDCSFYHLADQKFTQAKEEVWLNLIQEATSKGKHSDVYNRSKAFMALPALQRAYCFTCSELLGSKRTGHGKCTLKTPLFDSLIAQPTLFLPPKESSKFEAQYMFSTSSVEIIMGMLNQLSAKKVLCLGTPRLFEAISVSPEKNMSSLLMDIDSRYCAFFSPSQFVRYNMFNHHFFDGEKSKDTYQQFITGEEKLVVVCDPPFGGRMELLAHNLLVIQNEWRAANKLSEEVQLSVFFIFPYFMEPQVLGQLPNFVMLDYQVDYDNHPLYSSGPKGMIQGSAVRIYVNDRPSLFALPEGKGYRLCDICDRWVRSTNKHCNKCNGCVSKDGRTYKHCDDCNKCVKPSWNHCSSCQKCQPQDHRCGDTENKVKNFLCHSCGKDGHKRIDCPDRKRSLSVSEIDTQNKKRKFSHPIGVSKISSAGSLKEKNRKKKNKKKKTAPGNQVGNKNEIPVKNEEAGKILNRKNKNKKKVLSNKISNGSGVMSNNVDKAKENTNANSPGKKLNALKKKKHNKKNSVSLSPKLNKENLKGSKTGKKKIIESKKKSIKNKKGKSLS
ncbi:rRNA N6-adenosine-methyltransferase ZCCHC4 [Palaemon carinicauda]|uniref:rRNA N6-adenosine-methyltransferase ZCCHC4 n=1 Tax=Palaemon carinicauda TaxID=392227 RepID=UPI0035B596C1